MAFTWPPKVWNGETIGVIRRLFSETGRDYLPAYGLVLGLNILIGVTAAANAWLIKYIVDGIFFEKNATILYLVSFAVLAIGLFRGVSIYSSSVALGRIGNAVVARIQRRIYAHLLSLGVDYYARTPSSDLVTRLTHNSAAARDVLNLMITSIGRDVVSLIALVGVMFVQSPLITLGVLCLGPVTILAIGNLVRRVRRVAREQFDSLSMVTSDMLETARGIRIVKAFGLERLMSARMERSVARVEERANKIVRINARTSPIMEVIGGAAIASVVFLSGYQAIYMDVNPGGLTSFIAALIFAYDPARRLGRVQVTLESALVGVRMMYELLDEKPALDPRDDAPDLAVEDGTVTFTDVDFTYPGERQLFRKFAFRAEGGHMTALVGPSGAGKSTIMSLIERFYTPESGTVAVDGQDIGEVNLRSVRASIAFVSQDIVLFRDTIRENIRYGRPEATDEEVEQAARSALAHDFIVGRENGYDTVLDDSATLLSGGQRQRIAIARAMLRDAPIILLDEATSSLDTESEQKVQQAFDRLTEGRTTIVIAHRLSTVLHADKICVLDDGHLVEEGPHAELMARHGAYARLYEMQFRSREAFAEALRHDAPATDEAEPAQ